MRLFALIASLLTCLFAASVQAAPSKESRVALVIGNSDYRAMTRLRNPVNDAQDMAKLLKNIGFETIVLPNANRDQVLDGLERFQRNIRSESVALVFFAGHGVQVAGRNYLLPTDAKVDSELAVKNHGIALDDVLATMEAANARIRLVYLDACRDTPPQLLSSTRSAAQGLAKVPQARGTLIEFATEPGMVAKDGGSEQRNSPFTAALLRHLGTPDLQIEDVSKLVAAEVMQATRNTQRPWSEGKILGSFVPVPGKGERPQIVINAPAVMAAPESETRTPKRKTQEDCTREAAEKDIDQRDFYAFTQACLAGREYKVAKSESECVAESQQRGIHPNDLVDFVTACKYGKPYQVVQRKSPNDCIKEAQQKGLKGMDLAEYAKKCYGGGGLK